MVGIEADISFPGNMTGTSILATPSIGAVTYSDLVEMSGSVRTRIGYAFDRWLYYGTAGYAWTADHLTRTQLSDNPAGASGGTVESKFPRRSGWTVGAGVEAPLVPHWTTRLEYLYSDFGTASVTFPLAGQRFDSNLSTQEVRIGLNYQLSSGSGSRAGNGSLAPRRQLECSWPDHLCQPIRAAVSCALPRRQQPRHERGPRDLGRNALCRAEALAGRRTVG